jgi:serine/threonine-protein kinase
MPIAKDTRLGSYEIISSLGSGGMGEVYLAEDNRLQRKVALKILSADLASDRSRMHASARKRSLPGSLAG